MSDGSRLPLAASAPACAASSASRFTPPIASLPTPTMSSAPFSMSASSTSSRAACRPPTRAPKRCAASGAPLGDAREMISRVRREPRAHRFARANRSTISRRTCATPSARSAATAPSPISAIAIIALGIGASATVFSVANALLVRPLPFRDPEQLVWMANGNGGGLSGQTAQVNHLVALARAQNAPSRTSPATSRSTESATRASCATAMPSA